MNQLKIKSKTDCRWDCVSLGEVMLRLDPGDERIHTARSLKVWEGGGEYNVARGLKRCFGLDTALVTSLGRQCRRPVTPRLDLSRGRGPIAHSMGRIRRSGTFGSQWFEFY